jgi:hypothetical protein
VSAYGFTLGSLTQVDADDSLAGSTAESATSTPTASFADAKRTRRST